MLITRNGNGFPRKERELYKTKNVRGYADGVNEKETIFAEERQRMIVELVNKYKKVTVPEMSEYFKVSSATIRNDLRELENARLLIRTHGGAIVNSKAGFELTTSNKEVQNLQEKMIIAELAIDLIEDGDTIIMDTGTTTFELAKRLHKKGNITAVVNDLEIARCLEDFDNVNVVFLGGYIRKNFHCTVGPPGIRMLFELTVDKAFLGVNGLSLAKGATTPDLNHAETKKAMIAAANKAILLCDSSKLEKNSFVQFAKLQNLDIVIIDAIDEKLKRDYEKVGVEVITPK